MENSGVVAGSELDVTSVCITCAMKRLNGLTSITFISDNEAQ